MKRFGQKTPSHILLKQQRGYLDENTTVTTWLSLNKPQCNLPHKTNLRIKNPRGISVGY